MSYYLTIKLSKMTSAGNYTTELKYKILGFNDDQCECDVCGKQELKGTYAMEVVATGEIFRAGSTCGAKMSGWTTKEFATKYKLGQKENIENAKKELRESSEYKAYNEGLDFLNKESDELQRKLWNCPSQDERNALHSTERTFESRMKYIEPLRQELDKKRLEVADKYNLSKDVYLN